MPFDFDRVIDHQLYLATQQCIQPYAQQRRVSSAPVPSTAAAAALGPARAAGARKSSLGSLVSPWSPFSGGGSSSSSNNNDGNPRSLAAYSYQPRRPQGSSPVDLFFTAPIGRPVRRGGGFRGRGGGVPAHLVRDESSSSLDHFVTAPVGDYTTGADAASATELLHPRRGSGSRPGSSDTDDWAFATASGGSVSGTCSGLDTTVDLTPSPPPSSSSLRTGKTAAHVSSAAALKPPQQLQTQPVGPAPARVPAPAGVSAVTLPVRDLRRTRRFYELVFGAPCLSASEDGRSAALRLNNGALVVTLRECREEKRRGNSVGQGVLLSVPVDDVGEVYRRLRRFAEEDEEEEGDGGDATAPRFAEPVVVGGLQVVMFSDPSGYRWQVGQEVEDL